jgi:hypothetical protein
MARGPLFCPRRVRPPFSSPLTTLKSLRLDTRSLSCVGQRYCLKRGFQNAHHVQSNRRSGSHRYYCTLAFRLSPCRQWLCRRRRARGIRRWSYCRQRARTANGVCRAATASLLRASFTGLRRATSLRRARARLRWTGVLRASVSRSSTLATSNRSSVSQMRNPASFAGAGSLSADCGS